MVLTFHLTQGKQGNAMELNVYVEYLGRELLAGTIDTSSAENEGFQYSNEWLERGPNRPLSLSLPLQQQRFGTKQVRPYFDGLLPEGAPRSSIARQLHVSSRSYVKILAGIGWECIGAVSVHGKGARPKLGYEELSEESFTEIIASLIKAGAWEDGQTRFSLAGAQPKVSLYREPSLASASASNWFKPVGGAPSTHIIKPTSPRFSDAATNEALCTIAAGKCGINVPSVKLIEEEIPCICTERFDRAFDSNCNVVDDLPIPHRLHQEDLCQALGIVPEHKYEEGGQMTYLAKAAQLIRSFSTDILGDLTDLWDRVVFAYLTGDCDMHLKNIALIRNADWTQIRLAPAYDLIATAQYPGLSRDMAFGIGGVRNIEKIGLECFLREADKLNLSKDWAHKRVQNLSSVVIPALEQAACEMKSQGFSVEETTEKIINETNKRAKALL